MDIDQERAEFEAWYRLHHGSLDVYERDASGEYDDKQVQGAFNVWMARAALTIKLMPAPIKETIIRALIFRHDAGKDQVNCDKALNWLYLSQHAALVAARVKENGND